MGGDAWGDPERLEELHGRLFEARRALAEMGLPPDPMLVGWTIEAARMLETGELLVKCQGACLPLPSIAEDQEPPGPRD